MGDNKIKRMLVHGCVCVRVCKKRKLSSTDDETCAKLGGAHSNEITKDYFEIAEKMCVNAWAPYINSILTTNCRHKW